MPRTGKKRKRSPDEKWKLVIYLAGNTPLGLSALENLKRICQEYLNREFRIEVVDLLAKPEAARRDHIIVVPTVVRKRPLPVKKLFGNLMVTDLVVRALELPDGRLGRPRPP